MKIAIVEDDINMRRALESAFEDHLGFEVALFKNAKEALKKLDATFELVVTDLTMPGMDGLELLRTLGGRYDAIVITGNATLSRAIDAMRLGVKDFLTKPFEMQALLDAIGRLQKLKKSVVIGPAATQFLGSTSKALAKPIMNAQKAARTDVAVLLLGESGVGKEVFANLIHKNSPRSHKPFVAVNMAALPDTMVESELFGFEKGSFTDAHQSKPGRFEEAHGGTLFLDEIAEMSYPLQAKLLRAIQEKTVRRIGGEKEIAIDVRIVAATNQNIQAAIREGRLREDLYYRLNTVEILIPPLRDRTEEVLPIAGAILYRVNQQYGLGEKTLSANAQKRLLEYRWPGNIRELISVCERAAILSEHSEIDPEDLYLLGD